MDALKANRRLPGTGPADKIRWLAALPLSLHLAEHSERCSAYLPPIHLTPFHSFPSLILTTDIDWYSSNRTVARARNSTWRMFSNLSNTAILGGTFTQINRLQESATVAQVLLRDAAAPAAFHNSGSADRLQRCHPNTRRAVLAVISEWISGVKIQETHIDYCTSTLFWLFGSAGAGKTALARELAERYDDVGYLLASFFFSRTDHTRNSTRRLIATIAYQLTLYHPSLQENIFRAIELDPLVFSRSLATQFKSLVVGPIQAVDASVVFDSSECRHLIIIDGLDECITPAEQTEIIQVLTDGVLQYGLPVVIFFSSRPAPEIKGAFTSHKIMGALRALNLNRMDSSQDIRLYLQEEFANIRENHPFKKYLPGTWPSEDDIEFLVDESSNQFIYAATVIRFVKYPRDIPSDRLEIIRGLQPADKDMPFAELDALYAHTLSSVSDIEAVLRIIGLLLIDTDDVLPLSFILDFFDLTEARFDVLFCDLHSLISIYTNEDWTDFIHRGQRYIELHHASLQDFLLDARRSKGLYIDLEKMKREYVFICFKQLKAQKVVIQTCLEILFLSLQGIIQDEAVQFALDDFTEFALGRGETLEGGCFLSPVHLSETLLLNDPQRHKNLYAFALKLIDQVLIQHIPIYYSNEHLTFLVAIVGGIEFSNESPLFSDSITARKLFGYEEYIQSTDLQALDVFQQVFNGLANKAFASLLRDFLTDENRSGTYALNGERYTIAALACLKYLNTSSCPENVNSVFAHPSCQDETVGATYPAQTSCAVQCDQGEEAPYIRDTTEKLTEGLGSLRLADSENIGQYFSEIFGSPQEMIDNIFGGPSELRHIKPFILGLEALTFLLDRASFSERLVDMVSSYQLPSSAGGFPQRVIADAYGAVERYLKRVSDA